MTIIQNVACIPVTIHPEDRRISFKKDVLIGKKILKIFFCSSYIDEPLKTPLNDTLTPSSDIQDIGLFLNLQDTAGNQFVKDAFYYNSDISFGGTYLVETNIDRVLNLDQSFLNYKSTLVTSVNILVYVLYQTENFASFDDAINGSITIELPVTSANQDIKLSTLINYTLKGKKIKRIISEGKATGYLELYADKKYINNFPIGLLKVYGPKGFFFDDLIIDFEKSFYLQRNAHVSTQKLTFIY